MGMLSCHIIYADIRFRFYSSKTACLDSTSTYIREIDLLLKAFEAYFSHAILKIR